MSQRKYSVSEIDQMRGSLMMICRGDEKAAEDRLRTYMLNGTGPEELIQDEAEAINRRFDSLRRPALPFGSVRFEESFPGSGHFVKERVV